MILLLVTIIPSLIILAYFIFSDKFREPVKSILIVFLLGVAITLPAGYLNSLAIENFSNADPVNNALVIGFLAGGLVEELLKSESRASGPSPKSLPQFFLNCSRHVWQMQRE